MSTYNRSVVTLASTVLLLLATGAASGDVLAFTYEIVPLDLPRGHHVAGTFTTNCNNCELAPANIIDYQISVSGPRPFEFTPAKQGAYAGPFGSLGEVIATPTGIVVPASPDRSFWGLVFLAEDNTADDCIQCSQQIDWALQTINNVVEAQTSYFFFLGVDPPTIDHWRRPFGDLIVATFVPEPSSGMLATIGTFALLFRCRRKL